MNKESLATEILHEIKAQSKRYFIMLIIAIVLLFGSNIAWLYAWNTSHAGTQTISGEDNANVLYNSQGEIDFNENSK